MTMSKILASNKKASYEYVLFTKYEVGIALMGSEVKSARGGRVNIS